jgi:choline dehydrogenase-like flavoprotein
MPFLNWHMIGRTFEPSSYQYHQLAIGVQSNTAAEYVHGLITTLKTAMMHPIAQTLPFDMRTNTLLVRNFHAALGLVNINFSDQRRESNYLTLDTDGVSPKLAIHYQPSADEPEKLSATVALFRRLLLRLGCIAPPPMTHTRPMGASVHYAGTIPMTRDRRSFACSEYGQSYDFPNLYFVDGSGFPFLPAKNLTFTLMANAARIAARAF